MSDLVANLESELPRLSQQEVGELLSKLCRHFVQIGGMTKPFAIEDACHRPVAYLITPPTDRIFSSEAEFIAKMKDRIANPPDRYLTVDEFVAAVDADD
jgi:hypothetical protein